ncbi:DUF2946 family protein [Acinetobacter sp. ANC 4648]|uniref:DUF2946 family protein n=1 Tax=Acinetobacter sp. ANC 4648 TaxID=1977875 RepID=UPI000A356678|nr:DUF2946 family protein [Acinetobacter sp. ANC 4648]OTG80389.1 DUF2946 domain-containing protein [Acinetobacter sp. ANC 4648]
MLRRSGLLLALATVLLQLAVFLQPLLPDQYQIAPVCEHITHALLHPSTSELQSNKHISSFTHHYLNLDHIHDDVVVKSDDSHHHEMNHQCQYCVVYGHLVLPPELGVKEILLRIQIRLVAFVQNFKHVYFNLQRLFLIPQGRAPPVFFT